MTLREPQQQAEAIAVAGDRLRAGVALLNQTFQKELLQ
jgi:hypothetical protein